MKILVDMNLSPRWVDFLSGKGIKTIHWSSIGPVDAPDTEIMAYAQTHGFVILTNDLDSY
jgi:predicted nuclease of predicted toxin-antitoxin system